MRITTKPKELDKLIKKAALDDDISASEYVTKVMASTLGFADAERLADERGGDVLAMRRDPP